MRQKDVDWLVQVWSRDVEHVPAEQVEGYRFALGTVCTELARWDLNRLDLSALHGLVNRLDVTVAEPSSDLAKRAY